MMENKLAEEAVEAEILRICEEFEVKITNEQREVILPAVAQGRLYLSGDQIVYTLARPTDQIKELKFSEPTAGQSERAGKGVRATKTDKGAEIDIGDATKMTTNMASAMTGAPVGHIVALKRRDMKVVEVIVNFFE